MRSRMAHQCDMCGQSFENEKNVITHMYSHTGGSPEANETGKDSLTDRHNRKHTKRTGEQSDRTFTTKLKPFKHIQKNKRRKSYTCKLCGMSFSELSRLDGHKWTHYVIKKKGPNVDVRYRCKYCGETFNDIRTRDKHVNVHKEETHTELKEVPFVCKYCNKTFKTNLSLRYHVRIHTGEKPYSCRVCEKAFSVKSNLIRHQKSHDGFRPFTCQLCGKSCADQRNFEFHISIHTGIGLHVHKCDICDASFARKFNCDRHMRTHTSDCGNKAFSSNKRKQYTCQLCGKSFADQRNFKEHTSMHTGIGLHKCDICAASFARKNNRDTHMRTHTSDCGNKAFSFKKRKKYPCQLCGKSFADQRNFKDHTSMHTTGIGLHKCDICAASFARKDNRDRHMRTHTGECGNTAFSSNKRNKQPKCNMCKASFSNRDTLKRHLLIHKRELHMNADLGETSPELKHDAMEHIAVCRSKPNDISSIDTEAAATADNLCVDSKINSLNSRNNNTLFPIKLEQYSSYTCDVCDETFKNKSILERHIQIHTWDNTPPIL